MKPTIREIGIALFGMVIGVILIFGALKANLFLAKKAAPLETFSGTLLIDHGESYLVQTGKLQSSIQTPIIMQLPSSPDAETSQLLAQATSYSVNQKHWQTGSSISLTGTVTAIGSIPFIKVEPVT